MSTNIIAKEAYERMARAEIERLQRVVGKQAEALAARTTLEPAHPVSPGRIGSDIDGGLYAGVMRGVDGAPDYLLLLGPEMPEAASWTESVEWAKSLSIAGHRDYSLPTRKEQRLLFTNLQDQFESESYWSGEQHAGYPINAWTQDFTYGDQIWHKDNKLRARAVRRIPLLLTRPPVDEPAHSTHEPTAAEVERVTLPLVTLTGWQVRHLWDFLDLSGGDSDDESDVTVQWFDEQPPDADGEPFPAGYYAYFTEYPEEGRLYLPIKGEEAKTAPARGSHAALVAAALAAEKSVGELIRRIEAIPTTPPPVLTALRSPPAPRGLAASDPIKPCPFCGDYDLDGGAPWPADRDRTEWVVRCGDPSCNAEIRASTREAVIEAWERRTTPPASAEPRDDHAELRSFYQVDSDAGLIDAMLAHVERLQAKLSPNRIDEQPRTPREG